MRARGARLLQGLHRAKPNHSARCAGGFLAHLPPFSPSVHSHRRGSQVSRVMCSRPYNYGRHPADHDPRRGSGRHARPDAEAAVYGSGVTDTTIGDGDLVLAKPWRVLAPIEGLTGILMCGLSTGVCCFAVVNRIDQAERAPTSGAVELAGEGNMTSAFLWGMFAAS